ncbi:N-acetylmuramoyl-L-alanine amidase [Ruminiclostridium sufflavum DSM 19573]|uniref:N-acetylmuramoyl-L-alanine amidase n=1 Tax=Ruminiclostridium sufflavum DSM 19573 TaxID=1121337 RepID=A0A318XM78_9FIRM|nr:N-acetylmuramoyl-L-alanine amidase [Ruminiclostridium sufflavum]PYG88847.1 N-acetylmuramoyl-L-alanine amidase [Ruminiclostridium sufflavum DSM 19573]
MKKLLILFGMIFSFITAFSAAAFAQQPINVIVNEKKINFPDAQPFIDSNNRTQTPVKFIAEELGADVSWNGEEKKATFVMGDITLVLYIGDINYTINGQVRQMDTSALLKDDRTYVPAKYVAEAFGAEVRWESSSKTVYVNMDKGDNNDNTAKDNDSTGTDNPADATDANNTEDTAQEPEGENNGTASGTPAVTLKTVKASMTYYNKYDRVYFALKGIKLANVGSTVTNYFTESYDTKNNKYTITLPASFPVCLAEEVFNINDSRVSTVEIRRNFKTYDTQIVISAKKQFKFFISYNEKLNQSEINLLTPAKDGELLVVIDAGHGGIDPGACYSNTYEKDLNLAIALKLEKLLKEKNIKTFMLRQDDTFVALYDRPYIANALNASLFISIHNNSIDNGKVSGTETLYYPEKDGDTSFTGEKFAKIIQDSLINKLKTVNRKTVERPLLVVLRYTKMPAALSEIGFLTSASDLKNLKSEAFQQKTAEALRDAIVKGLGQLQAEKKSAFAEPESEGSTFIE